MTTRISPPLACLALLLANLSPSAAADPPDAMDRAGPERRESTPPGGFVLAAKAADALPTSRDALFGDDEPAPEAASPASREAPEAAAGVNSLPAASLPVSRDSLFGDDEVLAPGAAAMIPGASATPAGWRGFVQNVMAYDWEKPAHWSEMMTRVDLAASGSFNSHVKWKIGARIDYDATYTLTDFYPQAVADDQRFNVLLRENYLDIGAGNWDFRLGRQQIVWGEMVGLLFGDVVSAKDMRQFILPEFEILRIPQWAARAEYFENDFHAEFLWIPVASYDNIGKPGSEFYAYTPPPPPGVESVFRNEKIPARSLANTNYGLRLSLLRDGWDVAAFAYSSMNVAPTFYREIVAAPQPTVIYQARHDRIDQFGSTLAKDFGSFLVKAEAVYTRGRGYEVINLTDPDGVVSLNTLSWVLGLDYTEIADTRINFQLFQNHIYDHDPDIIPAANENGYSLLVNHRFGDKVEAQALWISSLNRTDWLLRPRVSWNFEKNWRLALGVDLFNGPPFGYFGRYDDRDRVYTEVRYSF
ncbi:MAG: DUF1302 family protein [Candidatus Accumulibacter sp. UW26]